MKMRLQRLQGYYQGVGLVESFCRGVDREEHDCGGVYFRYSGSGETDLLVNLISVLQTTEPVRQPLEDNFRIFWVLNTCNTVYYVSSKKNILLSTSHKYILYFLFKTLFFPTI